MASAAATFSQHSVHCPRWLGIAGLTHGTTLRSALPEPGKDDFFRAITRARAVGAIPETITLGAEQVHEETIACVCEPIRQTQQPAGFRYDETLQAGEYPATDALVTSIPGIMLTIQTADCLPIFLIDETARIAGLAHCGWRGLYAGLAGKTAQKMLDCGAVASRLQAWLGPCIQAGQYEVGRKLADQFHAAFPGAAVSPDGTHLDLAAVARWQLEQAGLASENIQESGECTRARSHLYHSYRGEGEQSGRMLSYLGFDLAPGR